MFQKKILIRTCFFSSDADETQESLPTDNDMEQSTEEFLLTDYEYDVLPPHKRVHYDLSLHKIIVKWLF